MKFAATISLFLTHKKSGRAYRKTFMTLSTTLGT